VSYHRSRSILNIVLTSSRTARYRSRPMQSEWLAVLLLIRLPPEYSFLHRVDPRRHKLGYHFSFPRRQVEKVIYLSGWVTRPVGKPLFCALFAVLKRCSTCGSPLDGFPVKKGETATHDLEVSSRLCASRQDRGDPKTTGRVTRPAALFAPRSPQNSNFIYAQDY
jgi:hypothetical protein